VNAKELRTKNGFGERRYTQGDEGTRLPVGVLEAASWHSFSLSFFPFDESRGKSDCSTRAALQRGVPWQILCYDTSRSLTQLVKLVNWFLGLISASSKPFATLSQENAERERPENLDAC
jgi:hypothetical protein